MASQNEGSILPRLGGIMTSKPNFKPEQPEEPKLDEPQEPQDQPGQPQSAILITFDGVASANISPSVIGQVTPTQLLLAAAYLQMMAEREVGTAWMQAAQRRAEIAQVAQAVSKQGRGRLQ
jgi:hypothetical protein